MSDDAITGVDELDARLRRGDPVILDGGMGTELEARGVPMNRDAWSAVANLEHADTVEQAHVDFLTAGADVVIANTFPSGLFALEAAGLGESFEDVNRRAVHAALRARERAAPDRPVAVAGSISPMSAGADIHVAERSRQELLAAYRRQATVLADAGADFIVTEMIQSVQWHGPAVEAAVETDLPVWLGVSAGPISEGGSVPPLNFAEESLDQLVASLVELPVRAVAVMHTDIDDVDGALDVVQRRWSGPLAAYPHHGEYHPPSWTFYDLAPQELVRRAQIWTDRGVAALGGCCGIRPRHIQQLHDALRGDD